MGRRRTRSVAAVCAAAAVALSLAACAGGAARYLGSWRLTEASLGGQQITSETIDEAEPDAPSCLVVSEDGSLDYSVLGALASGRWEGGSDDSHATAHVGEDEMQIAVDGDKLTLTRGSDEGGQVLTFSRSAEDLSGAIESVRGATDPQAIDGNVPEATPMAAPLTAADDDVCLIRATDVLSYPDGHVGVRLSVTNRLDSALLIGCRDSMATVAGEEVPVTGGGGVEPGATVTMDMVLSGAAATDGASLEIDACENGTHEVLGTYGLIL